MTEYLSDQQFLNAIDAHWKAYYTPPTVRWLMRTLGLKSPHSVMKRLNRFHEDGKFQDIPHTGEHRKAVPLWVAEAIKDAI